jgi:hypothetical protein
MSFIAYQNCHMCGNEAERMLVGLGWEPNGLVSEGQLIHSMALV